jgi:hypothetical protein
VLGNKPEFYTLRVDGSSFAELLANWYFGTSGPTKVLAQPALPPDPGPPQCP